MSKDIKSYADEYINDYGFEAHLVRYRQEKVLSRLLKYQPRTVVEIGCGLTLQAAKLLEAGGSWDKWVIVEPSSKFAQEARNAGLPNLDVVEGFFEEVLDQVPGDADMILCSGLLHEVPSSDELLASITGKMSRKTVLHANVPNAGSFHRRLAKAMGLIDDLKSISERNALLQQPRVYDAKALQAQLNAHGLTITESGGYFVKPFTHGQMEQLVPILGQPVLDGLHILGEELPELASEVFCEAQLT